MICKGGLVLKRVLALTIALISILTVFGIQISALEEKSLYQEEVDVMKTLGIMQISDGESALSKTVTRGEFATYLANLMNLKPAEDPRVYFLDVQKESPYCGVLAMLYENNIISGGVNGNFEPDRPIVYEEAYKMLTEVCGYGILGRLSGGYPMGYLTVAKKFDILSDAVKSDTFTVSECAKVLFDASTATLHDRNYNSDSVDFYPTQETLLSRYNDVYTYEGVIESAFGASINDDSIIEQGRMIVGGKTFETEGQAVNFEDCLYLGVKIRGLYKKYSEDVNTLFYIWEYGKNETVMISADDFGGYDNYSISYYTENGSIRNANISRGAVYIFNGVRIDENVEKLYDDFESGTITLRKTESNSKFDIVILKSYESFVLGVYAKETNVLVEKNNAINSLDLNEYEYIKLYENGMSVKKLDYAENDVLTIAKCGQSVEIHKSIEKYTGVIKAISRGEKYTTIKIGDKEYEIIPKCYENQGDKLKVGVNCQVGTDIFGRVAYIEFDLNSDWIFAYAFQIAYKEGDFDDGENFIELYNQNKEFLVLSFAEKVIFDEEKIKGTQDISGYFPSIDENGQIKMQMIRYKLNSEGEIKEFDTCGEGENSIKVCGDGATSKKIYAPALSLFYDGANQQIAVNEKTLVMEVPYIGTTYEEIKDNRQLYFDVYEINKISAFTQTTVAGYRVGDEDFASIIIRTEETMELQDRINEAVIFEGFGTALDEKGDVCRTIDGYSFAGNKVTYLIENDARLLNMNDLDELSESDVVGVRSYSVDGINFARVVQKVYDNEDVNYEMPGKAQGWDGFIKDRMAWHHLRADYSNFILGNVAYINGNMLHLSTHKGGEAVQMYDTSKAPIVVYDKNASREKFYIGSLADIKDAKNFGNGGARVIIRKEAITPVGILVYK